VDLRECGRGWVNGVVFGWGGESQNGQIPPAKMKWGRRR
jgi:hypothetical protein